MGKGYVWVVCFCESTISVPFQIDTDMADRCQERLCQMHSKLKLEETGNVRIMIVLKKHFKFCSS